MTFLRDKLLYTPLQQQHC